MERSMNNKRFVAGIDGGGTKTACMLADLEGSVFACAAAGGSNTRSAVFLRQWKTFAYRLILPRTGKNHARIKLRLCF